MGRSQRQVPATHVRPQVVVVADTSFNRLLGFVKGVKYPVQAEVDFQDAVDPLGNDIILRISVFRHTNGNAGFSQFLHLMEATALAFPVRVVDKLLADLDTVA